MARKPEDRLKAGQSKNESVSGPDRPRRRQGIRTYVLLVFATAAVILVVTSLSLLLIRHRLRSQVADEVSQDLDRSVITFRNLQAERLRALDRENALLAELPTLKALMTSGDERTIQDGAIGFWQISSTDLFALANASGHIVAAYTNGASSGSLRQGLKAVLESNGKHYLIDGGSLYSCSVRPLFFGSDEEGTLLGYVVSGVSIERTVREISQPTGVDATFLSNGQIVASTLDPALRSGLAAQPLPISGTPQSPATVRLGNAQFLTAAEDLTAASTSPLQLVVLKSTEPAERAINRIDRIVLSTGLLALLAGAALMTILSRLVTRPLEELSTSVRAFGMGDSEFRVPRHGTREVRQLSRVFAAMRRRIQEANRALLESERLATIGSMASSVSHDLRHYLAAIYANAEFLASDRLSTKERAEIFADIRAAVLGTTDMIESLLIFSRTGSMARRSPELMATLLERAAALVRAHPDAEGVTLTTRYGDPIETSVIADGKQIERAIFNLLLNACQSVRSSGESASVTATLETDEHSTILNVVDNGPGVPDKIRKSLFEPFVSEGKQKGTGLGLTLAHCIAVEHGGEVVLLSSQPGETIFQMRVARASGTQDALRLPEVERHDRVIEHENARIRK
ncbi:MAG TPA: ATP-binding protein [Terracidiphilus sp.]|nr:ATP-binding protein [Terracidiphilus sp.]